VVRALRPLEDLRAWQLAVDGRRVGARVRLDGVELVERRALAAQVHRGPDQELVGGERHHRSVARTGVALLTGGDQTHPLAEDLLRLTAWCELLAARMRDGGQRFAEDARVVRVR